MLLFGWGSECEGSNVFSGTCAQRCRWNEGRGRNALARRNHKRGRTTVGGCLQRRLQRLSWQHSVSSALFGRCISTGHHRHQQQWVWEQRPTPCQPKHHNGAGAPVRKGNSVRIALLSQKPLSSVPPAGCGLCCQNRGATCVTCESNVVARCLKCM
jgi:hypothetical protein